MNNKKMMKNKINKYNNMKKYAENYNRKKYYTFEEVNELIYLFFGLLFCMLFIFVLLMM